MTRKEIYSVRRIAINESICDLTLPSVSASCGADVLIKIWDTQNEWKNTKTLTGHEHSVSSVRFMPGDDLIISASRDRTMRVWNVAMGYRLSPLLFDMIALILVTDIQSEV